MSDVLLDIKNLRLSFFTPAGEVKALNDVTFEMHEGDVLGIVGESGSGKSVTAYSIMGLVPFPGRIIGGTIDFTVTLGLLPELKTRLSFPLEALNSQKMFLDRTPGKLKTVVFGNKVSIDEIDRFALGTMKSFKPQKVEIFDFYLSDVEPDYPLPDVKLVDEMGQFINREWPGKTKDLDELKENLEEAVKPDDISFWWYPESPVTARHMAFLHIL